MCTRYRNPDNTVMMKRKNTFLSSRFILCFVMLATLCTSIDAFSATAPTKANSISDTEDERLYKLRGKLLKQVRQTCKDYQMLEEGDHIMVAVSGGKDSATILNLLLTLQEKLPISFNITAVHVDQKQPGYDGKFVFTVFCKLPKPWRMLT